MAAFTKSVRLLAWAVSAIVALAFMTQPVSVDAQLTLALSAIAAMYPLTQARNSDLHFYFIL